MVEKSKKFKVRYFSIAYGITDGDLEFPVNKVIDEECENGYEPVSVSMDLAHGHMCMILFKKIEKTSAERISKSRYENVVRMIEK